MRLPEISNVRNGMRNFTARTRSWFRRTRNYNATENRHMLFVRIQKFYIRKRAENPYSSKRRVAGVLATLIIVSFVAEMYISIPKNYVSRITPALAALVGESIPLHDGRLQYNPEARAYRFNEGYQAGGSTLGFSSTPTFSADFPVDASEGANLIDPVSGQSIKITPLFELKNGEKDGSRVVYPLEGKDGLKIVSLNGIGYKEDIVLNSYSGNNIDFSYRLEVPDTIDVRLESDGSVGFYGVESSLLGNVSAGTEADAELLESARRNGEKNNLLFRMPAPFVVEASQQATSVGAKFKLEGNILTTEVRGLIDATYPLTIDPSVYVETARKFMRGNNETNTDFDTANELIQKGSTTGARFDTWTSTLSLNEGLYDGSSAVAGGYIYHAGGTTGTGTATIAAYDSSGSFVVPSGVTSVTVKAWGGGGGSGGTNNTQDGGDGGGGGYATATLSVTASESLTVTVGGGGGAGTQQDRYTGGGGGGGGYSSVYRSATPLLIAPGGGGGGGGGDDQLGGDGGAGGDDSDGVAGGNSDGAQGGGAATSAAGGAGGTGGAVNNGTAGASLSGGDGGNGSSTVGTGGASNGGTSGGGDGGFDSDTSDYASGGAGGAGYYGGGGGAGSDASSGAGSGGGGGGSGTAYLTGASTSAQLGSGMTPGNTGDTDRNGRGDGAAGPTNDANGTAGDDGRVVISYVTSSTATVVESLYWANINDSTGALESPNPGDGVCTNWCTDTAYDLPEGRRGFSLVAYSGFLYAIGGEDPSGNREATIFIAKIGANGEPQLWHPTDPDTSNWDYWYTDTALGSAVSYHAAVTHNNRLYVLGGQTDASPGGVTRVEYANIEPTGTLDTWTTTGMLTLPSQRHQHSAEVYNDVLYVVGGDSSSTGTLQNSVEYVELGEDGAFQGSWETANSFTTGRRTNGNRYTAIYGAYLYLMGGCTSVSSGNCQTVGSDIQLASINADGSLGEWNDVTNETNQRVGYGLHVWANQLYRVGGCTDIVTSNKDCSVALTGSDRGVINTDGDASTVSITETSGSGNCVGGDPYDCDLPPVGDDAGEIGHMLTMSTILNGHLYVIGGCAERQCNTGTNLPTADNISSNTAYVRINSDGTLRSPSTCSGTTSGSWCVDGTNTINGADGVAAAGIATFNGRIYIVGGIDSTGVRTGEIYHNSVNTDGSLSGAWTAQTFTSVGVNSGATYYSYAYARANPSQAGTYDGNLFLFGGCGDGGGSGPGCVGYETQVYKCWIEDTGELENTAGSTAFDCTTTGQLQIDSDPDTGGSQGLGIHSGVVYANRIYLIGGFSQTESDKDTVLSARFDDSNNVVAISGSDWIEDTNTLNTGRRRGWAFGYNGYVYAIGGFDAGAGGIIDDIEFAKVNVSDGSVDPFTTSVVTVNQRWGLNVVVSNSYAYIIGGCANGGSPSSCGSGTPPPGMPQDFEPSLQTFQLHNNASGAFQDFDASAGPFATTSNRIGASAAVVDGVLYVAGGENAGTATANVQKAKLNPNGTIGTWSDATGSLPAARAYGQLETAGGDLYYIGGEDTAGDEKSDVYYASPAPGTPTADTIRTTQYKLAAGEFTGTTYTLGLKQDLESNYYVMVSGSTSIDSDEGPNDAMVRIDGDPFGNLGTTTSADEILLSRSASNADWAGSVTVVECAASCSTDGFTLSEVADVSLAAGTADSLQTTTHTLSIAHTARTVPFGGHLGGGLQSAGTLPNDFGVTGGVRISKSSTHDIDIERYGGGGRVPQAGDVTIYVVEWGSNWDVYEVDVDNWTAGGSGADATNEYVATDIVSGGGTSVTRDEAWVWKSTGTSEDDGLGDGAFGKIVTLGDGVNQNATETTVAIGSRHAGSEDIRDDTIYVMEHPSLATDYRKISEVNHGSSFTVTVDSPIESETVSTTGNVTSSEGYRIPLFYYSDSGTGGSYSRTGGWSHYHSNDTTVSLAKSRTGSNQPGWLQSVDFGSFAGVSGDGDIASWSTATNGLPGDRTRHGAAVWNDRIYVVGGLDDSATETNTVYISPQLSSGGNITSAWTSDADVPDVARSGGTLVAYANNLYFIGGNDGTNYLLDSQFTQINSDGTVDAWTFTTNLPVPASDAEGFAANGFLYIIGGRTAASTCNNNSYVVPISANTTIATGNNPTGVGEWYQTNTEFTGDRHSAAVAYNEGTAYVLGGGCGTELTSDQHWAGRINSQPQVARYSYYVDADSDVFPSAWLLNGVDNDIGARWQFSYRSSTDAANEWGVVTDFGDVTLGSVEDYTPFNDVGSNTNFARYMYVEVAIDASQTYGYPDDVSRGPTVDDMTIFFVSDPNKRLRHGKTFIQGVQQPLGTPPPGY